MAGTMEIVESVMGPVGLIVATMMFCSSYPTLKDIISRKSVGEYSFFPYFVQVCNCSLWVLYSIADPDVGLWPLITNAVGLVVASLTCLTFFTYVERRKKVTMFFATFPVLVLIYTYGIFAIVVKKKKLEHELANWEGTFCMVVNMIMYAGPLAGIASAVKNKSTEFLPLSLGVTTLICSTPWFLYGCAIGNLNIWLPNACGIIFGPIQMVTYCCLSRSNDRARGESLVQEEIKQGNE